MKKFISKMDEYEEKGGKSFAALMRSLSTASKIEVEKHEDFDNANREMDPAVLGIIIKKIHHLAGSGSEEDQAARLRTLHSDLNNMRMGREERL